MARRPNRRLEKKQNNAIEIAINELFANARKIVKDDQTMANRYVNLARELAMSKRIRLTSEKKRQFCKHCYSYILPGFNSKVRVNNSSVIYHCNSCKKMSKVRIK